jgi:hypothetical protein
VISDISWFVVFPNFRLLFIDDHLQQRKYREPFEDIGVSNSENQSELNNIMRQLSSKKRLEESSPEFVKSKAKRPLLSKKHGVENFSSGSHFFVRIIIF